MRHEAGGRTTGRSRTAPRPSAAYRIRCRSGTLPAGRPPQRRRLQRCRALFFVLAEQHHEQAGGDDQGAADDGPHRDRLPQEDQRVQRRRHGLEVPEDRAVLHLDQSHPGGPHRVGERRTDHAEDGAGDEVAGGEVVADTDGLPERQRQQDERVQPSLGEDDGDRRYALRQILDDELEDGVAEAAAEAGGDAARPRARRPRRAGTAPGSPPGRPGRCRAPGRRCARCGPERRAAR